MKALIFDMDGTLTPATQKISKEMLQTLEAVPNGFKKYLVTGSDMSKVINQIPESFLLDNFSKVFTCNGTRVYNTSLDLDDETRPLEPELVHKIELIDHYSQADINHLISRLLAIASESHTKYKTGTFIEWRGSQINFSVIGRNCSTDQREDYVKWDTKSGERERIIKTLREEFKGWGLSFRLGGQISIDITRSGWDKSYAFETLKYTPDQCVFFGDKICKDGNDFDIAMKCAKYHMIENPADLILQLQEYV